MHEGKPGKVIYDGKFGQKKVKPKEEGGLGAGERGDAGGREMSIEKYTQKIEDAILSTRPGIISKDDINEAEKEWAGYKSSLELIRAALKFNEENWKREPVRFLGLVKHLRTRTIKRPDLDTI